ncbi:hypothetical protein BB561_003763 [Smittium simulii]|uniref:Uncharacterized protein n=1 Tax=Smittium simulii TaxID=133385 RepID=A0A2T9YJK3_9FUNG|nr:hypothetical protein BB561_003763 [Smittium simulii]
MSKTAHKKEKPQKQVKLAYTVTAKENGYNPIFFITPSNNLTSDKLSANSVSADNKQKNISSFDSKNKADRIQKYLIPGKASSKTNNNLILSIIDDNLDIFEQIVSSNFYLLTKTDFYGISLLMLAANYNSPKVTLWLCQKKQVDLNSQDSNGNTPLHYAAAEGSEKCTEILLSYGAHDFIQNYATLQLACYHGSTRALRVYLLMGVCNVNHKDNSGKTALMLASLKGRISIVLLLLEYGAKTKSFDNNGMSALMYASIMGKLAICYELLEYDLANNFLSLRHLNNSKNLALQNNHLETSYLIDDYIAKCEVSLSKKNTPINYNKTTDVNNNIFTDSDNSKVNSNNIDNKTSPINQKDSNCDTNVKNIAIDSLPEKLDDTARDINIRDLIEKKSSKSKSATAVEHGVETNDKSNSSSIAPGIYNDVDFYNSRKLPDNLSAINNTNCTIPNTSPIVGLGFNLEKNSYFNPSFRQKDSKKDNPSIANISVNKENVNNIDSKCKNELDQQDLTFEKSEFSPGSRFKSYSNVSIYSIPEIIMNNPAYSLINEDLFFDANSSLQSRTNKFGSIRTSSLAQKNKYSTERNEFNSSKHIKQVCEPVEILSKSLHSTFDPKNSFGNIENMPNKNENFITSSDKISAELKSIDNNNSFSNLDFQKNQSSNQPINNTQIKLMAKVIDSKINTLQSIKIENSPYNKSLNKTIDYSTINLDNLSNNIYTQTNSEYFFTANSSNSGSIRVYNKLPQIPYITSNIKKSSRVLDSPPYTKILPKPPTQGLDVNSDNNNKILCNIKNPQLGKILAKKKNIRNVLLKIRNNCISINNKDNILNKKHILAPNKSLNQNNINIDSRSLNKNRISTDPLNSCINELDYPAQDIFEPNRKYKDLPHPKKKYMLSVINKSFFVETQPKINHQRKSLPAIPQKGPETS